MAYEMKQPGSYFGVLVEAGLDTLNNEKKTPFMYLVFDVTHIAENGEWSALPESFKKDVRFFLSEKAWEYTQRDLEKLGFDGNFDDPKFNAAMYADGIELMCQHEVGQDNKLREAWSVSGTGGGTKERKAPEKTIVRDLSAKWKNSQAANKKPSGGPAKPPVTPAAAPAVANNDDMPF